MRPPLIKAENIHLKAEGKQILNGISLEIRENEIFGIMGPAGGGKTSFLRLINRTFRGTRVEMRGRLQVLGEDVLSEEINPTVLRRKVSMVFATPVVLPMSIFENLVTDCVSRGSRIRPSCGRRQSED